MNDDVWNGDGKWRSIAEPLWGKNDTFHSRILSVHQAPSVILLQCVQTVTHQLVFHFQEVD